MKVQKERTLWASHLDLLVSMGRAAGLHFKNSLL